MKELLTFLCLCTLAVSVQAQRSLGGEWSLGGRFGGVSGISLKHHARSNLSALELIAAVSAPTSLALDAAQRAGITLCAFVRADRATVFTHPQRVTG